MTRCLLIVAIAILGNGCAAVTNPVADGVPAHRLPSELMPRPKSEMVMVPLNRLRLPEPPVYLLDKDDVLAVIAGDLFGPENLAPPVNLPVLQTGAQEQPASVGYPVPVREDGTIALPSPKIPPIPVKGKSLIEVENLVRKALVDSKLFREGQARVSVQLQKRRRYSVTVIREDTQPLPSSGSGVLTLANRRNGIPISLEAYRNDILHALTLSGGPPGLDAKNEVIIQRGSLKDSNPDLGTHRIPLRVYPEDMPNLKEEDITLHEGDILLVPSRENEVFYTGGIIGSRQILLPRDYDLDVLQAVAIVGGPLVNGGFTQNAFIAQSVATGMGNPSPALVTVLRQLPNGQQLPIRVDIVMALRDRRERILMQPNDLLIMQEKPGDAIVRYLTSQFKFNTSAETIRSANIQQSLSGTVP